MTDYELTPEQRAAAAIVAALIIANPDRPMDTMPELLDALARKLAEQ